jgi:glycosyltransferase involved in cell wall biosynthesis
LISVIIPTFNRPQELQNCLASLKNQTLNPAYWEVVVINDGGCDVKLLVQSFGYQFRCADQKNSGPAKARNNGVAISSGQILAFLDDDCRAHPDWLAQIYQLSREGYLIGGKVYNAFTNNLFSEGSQVLLDFLYQNQLNTINMFFTSNNFSLLKVDFEKYGGFSEAFQTSAGEDREFCVRLHNMGMKMDFQPSIKVDHFHELNYSKFRRLHLKYGRAAFVYQEIIRAQGIDINHQPRLNFYLKMFRFPFSLLEYRLLKQIKLCVVLFVSQMYVAMGYFQTKYFTTD